MTYLQQLVKAGPVLTPLIGLPNLTVSQGRRRIG